MVSPKQLAARGVPVHRLVHEEGSFVVTFPNAFHSGFNTGALDPTRPCTLALLRPRPAAGVISGAHVACACMAEWPRESRSPMFAMIAHCRVQLRGGGQLWAAGLAAVRHRPRAEVPRRPEAAYPVPRRAAGAWGFGKHNYDIQGSVPTKCRALCKAISRWCAALGSAMLAYLGAAGCVAARGMGCLHGHSGCRAACAGR
jgi:JmjC domain, hydroxylase